MDYVDAMASMFWAWWHGGEALKLETLKMNQWASHDSLEESLQTFLPIREELCGRALPELPADPVATAGSEYVSLSHYSLPALTVDPAYAQEIAYRYLRWNISVGPLLGIGDVSYHGQMYGYFKLLYAISSFAAAFPGSDIPLTPKDFSVVAEEINARLNGAPDDGQIFTIANRLLDLTPEAATAEDKLWERETSEEPSQAPLALNQTPPGRISF